MTELDPLPAQNQSMLPSLKLLYAFSDVWVHLILAINIIKVNKVTRYILHLDTGCMRQLPQIFAHKLVDVFYVLQNMGATIILSCIRMNETDRNLQRFQRAEYYYLPA